ncbi:MAG: ABC transporter ATP-binding protein [Chloroflexi bacterium]|jgi:ABC-2 type transport system ATP-binding protein|nr:ABC transporter ATP-binding protein [Chloroflexota bacterium]MBT3670577.1 ABC transporter ATP-binding protein [Chloroflexota bacterium]MBT4002403.1 ABC transporter ATP-binding protein [Chloroflexota bacterium]MBT4304212.1 ABC transporter ATP-binding protein [Chloroflexota bacterium]MBT4533429.1 ABC transporter ATP-binding protein [Chloroflexota bacterium]
MDGLIAITANQLGKSFGKVRALDQINLQIKKGLVFGLLGPNGAGKTTFIRLLTGATGATEGNISLLGFDPIQQKREMRQKIGYMPQTPALYEDLSPIDNIRFFGRAKEIEQLDQRVDEVIDFIGLGDRANDDVYTFSGGMKQRVSLACALVHQPDVLLLDEPTSGIDPKLRETFWAHFRELAAQGVTILVSTHQLDEAMHCDRLGILHRGSLLANSTPKELLREKKAKVRINIGDKVEEHSVTQYPEKLPGILQKYGLDKTLRKIEIIEDTLESVVLDLINQNERVGDQKEFNNEHD